MKKKGGGGKKKDKNNGYVMICVYDRKWKNVPFAGMRDMRVM